MGVGVGPKCLIVLKACSVRVRVRVRVRGRGQGWR